MEEKRLLARKLKERDQQIKCDAVAARILAKPKSRKELDECVHVSSKVSEHQV